MSVAGCLRRFCVSGVEEVAPSMRIGTGANCVGPSFYELAPRLGSWPLHQLQSIHRIFKFLIKRVVSQNHRLAFVGSSIRINNSFVNGEFALQRRVSLDNPLD